MLEVIIIIALLIPLVAVILDSPPARALAARLERERGAIPPGDDRISALEAEVERLSTDVERLREESAFLQRLIETRSGSERGPSAAEGGTALPPGERRE